MANIRLWTIGQCDGEPNTWILPTKQMIERLKEKISAVNDGRTKDIIWGPEIKCQVIPEEGIDKFLVPVPQEDGTVLFRLENE